MMKHKKVEGYKGIKGRIEYSSNARIRAWQRLQFGMFIHWGLYAVFGGKRNGKPVKHGYSEQIQMWDAIPESEYVQAAEQFSGEKFHPETICQLAKDAGMTYVVVTSKHHDGFAMFDTETTDYNVVKRTPFGRDPLKMLADECARQGLGFGIYFSLVDWHLGHDFDQNNNNPIPTHMEPLIEAQLRELMTHYGEIVEVWFDMANPTTKQSNQFRDIVRTLQPSAVINSRIWNNTGDFRTLDDNHIPTHTLDNPWQTPASIYHETWGYRKWQERNDFTGKVHNLVKGLTSVKARGGNYLLNIGPLGDGSVLSFEAAVLQKIGAHVHKHPHAITGASATQFGGMPWGEVTTYDNMLYLHVMNPPEDGQIILPGLVTDVRNVTLDGTSEPLTWEKQTNQLAVTLASVSGHRDFTMIRVELAGELRVVPGRMVWCDADGVWMMKRGDMYCGRGFCDAGSYTSLVETVVRWTAFLVNEKVGTVGVRFFGVTEHPERDYWIACGDEERIVKGKNVFVGEVGSFVLHANAVNTLSIRLAEPFFPEEDLGLTLDRVEVKKIPHG